jgi:metal-sulfur cluster biosynthetic enzyme
MTPLQKKQYYKPLGTVQEPDLGQDLVTLNMIRNLESRW